MKRITAIFACFNYFVASALQNWVCLLLVIGGCQLGSTCAMACEEKIIEVSYGCCGSSCTSKRTVCVTEEVPIISVCQIHFGDNDIVGQSCESEANPDQLAIIINEREVHKRDPRIEIPIVKSNLISKQSECLTLKESIPQGVHAIIPSTILRI